MSPTLLGPFYITLALCYFNFSIGVGWPPYPHYLSRDTGQGYSQYLRGNEASEAGSSGAPNEINRPPPHQEFYSHDLPVDVDPYHQINSAPHGLLGTENDYLSNNRGPNHSDWVRSQVDLTGNHDVDYMLKHGTLPFDEDQFSANINPIFRSSIPTTNFDEWHHQQLYGDPQELQDTNANLNLEQNNQNLVEPSESQSQLLDNDLDHILELLADNGHTEPCIKNAKWILENFEGTVDYHQRFHDLSSDARTYFKSAAASATGRKLQKSNLKVEIPVLRYPIMLIRAMNREKFAVRLYRTAQLADSAPDYTRVERFKIRFANLISAIDVLHWILAPEFNMTPSINHADHDPIKWFEEIVFGPSEDSLPLIGNVDINKLNPQLQALQLIKDLTDSTLIVSDQSTRDQKIATYKDELKTLFGRAQLYLANFLAKPQDCGMQSLPKVALSLLGYWYQIKKKDLISADIWATMNNGLKVALET